MVIKSITHKIIERKKYTNEYCYEIERTIKYTDNPDDRKRIFTISFRLGYDAYDGEWYIDNGRDYLTCREDLLFVSSILRGLNGGHRKNE